MMKLERVINTNNLPCCPLCHHNVELVKRPLWYSDLYDIKSKYDGVGVRCQNKECHYHIPHMTAITEECPLKEALKLAKDNWNSMINNQK